MANASAEKLKTFGLRHGEKIVVGLTTALCLVFLGLAATKPTIDMTPEQVDKDAKAAESNLNNRQNPDDIVKRLEEAGIKNPDFEKMVDEQATNLLVAANYKAAHDWVYPQPGAGLIRDMPELIAPAELYAYPGRGGALLYALNENGERIPDESDAAKVEPPKTGRRRGRASLAEQRRMEEAQKEADAADRKRRAALAGKEKAEPEKDVAKEAVAEGPFKELVKGLRWASVTGTINYEKLRENFANALKRPELGYPHFKQLDVERQTKQPDGAWGDWEPLDAEQNQRVLNNMPEEEEELVPEKARFEALVDPLPFLKAGFWERVHVASLVPKEAIETPPAGGPTTPGMGPGAGGSRSMMASPMVRPEMMMGSPMMSPSRSPMSMNAGSDRVDFPVSDAETIMIRALDFTVEPEKTYRYRTRFVVFNPNKDREDVSPGVDNKSAELVGPWSDPTEEVSIPGDVAAYALKKSVAVPNRIEQVHFQVARWRPEDGVTVVREFDAGPGEIIGTMMRVPVPVQNVPPPKEGASRMTSPPSEQIDFNSHEVVLDAIGGAPAVPPGIKAVRFEAPVVSLLVRADGSMIVHDEANDASDEVRKDIASSAKRALDDWEKDHSQRGGAAPGRR